MEAKPTIEQLADRVTRLETQIKALKKSEEAIKAKVRFLESRPSASEFESQHMAVPPSSQHRPARPKGRILLMDDDEMIRELTGEKLSRLGYQPALAASGEEAVARFEKALREGRPFDVVILDLMVQSGMGGKEAVRRILDIDPHAKAIISSGYTNDPVTSNFWEYGFAAALAKPYQTGALEKLLESVMGGGASG